jgi:hypothetical protein
VQTYVFEGLSKIRVKATDENQSVRFHLTFQSSSKPGVVQFEVPSAHAMAFLSDADATEAARLADPAPAAASEANLDGR